MCTCKEFSQHFIPPLLILLQFTTESFQICVPAQGLLPGSGTPGPHTALDCQDYSRARSQPLYEGKQGYLQERVPASLLEKHAEFYRLQEVVMYRLHIVNSFTVMEIPNAVWPWKRIWSPFKGLSSEFPALAFSYCLSQFFWVHLCGAAGLGDGMGGARRKEFSQSNAFHTFDLGNGSVVCIWV